MGMSRFVLARVINGAVLNRAGDRCRYSGDQNQWHNEWPVSAGKLHEQYDG
jgi:hypothetical protein